MHTATESDLSCPYTMPDAGTGNVSPALTTIAVLLFLWALVAYLIRVYVKLWKSDGWNADDGAISAAIVSPMAIAASFATDEDVVQGAALAQLICVCYAVSHGYSETWQSKELSASERRPVAGVRLLLHLVAICRD